MLGAFLGMIGHLLHYMICGASNCQSLSIAGSVIVGLLALAYAVSDVGLLQLPRPSLMDRVPASWWQRWRPYRAAIAYGGTLGLGVTTYIPFGAFYLLCVWCVATGGIGYGALLMGIYGGVRSLALVPTSWMIYSKPMGYVKHLGWLLSQVRTAQGVLAFVMIIFGVQTILSVIL